MPDVENKQKKGIARGMRAELKKVIWPSAKQTAKSTLATIGFVLLISIILVVLNLGFDKLSMLWWKLIIK